MSSSPTTKLLRRNTRITRKIILANFWGQQCVNQNGFQTKLTNGVVFVLVHKYSNFGQFLVKFLPHSLQLFYDHVFAWNLETRIYFLCETQKYVEVLNNTWMITFFIGILAIFGNFWANICLVHFNHWLSGCIFDWNHGRQILSFRITQKIVPVLKYDQNFCRKLIKIAKFEVNLGYQGKFWTNWVLND